MSIGENEEKKEGADDLPFFYSTKRTRALSFPLDERGVEARERADPRSKEETVMRPLYRNTEAGERRNETEDVS